MPRRKLSILLIESDETCRSVLLHTITTNFPNIDIVASTTPEEALQLLGEKEHDIVVCDALLAGEERIRFAWQMCTKADPIVIVITADTDLHKDSFPSFIKDVCVQHVTYKPVDISDLVQKIADAVEKVEVRERDEESRM